jgi:carboxymethylenebutenolidase
MIEHDLGISTSDGLMNTFITHPEEGGPFPVVLLLMDAIGKREELHDWARRIGTVGYYVMLPNLFYRLDREYVPEWVDEEDEEKKWERMFKDIDSLSNAMVVEDCKALLNYSDQQTASRRGDGAILGFSMGGAFAFATAAKIPERIKAAASICGIRLHTDATESPHLDADKIVGELYFACAEDDFHIPRQEIDTLEAHLSSININYRIEIFPGTVHGFYYPLGEEDFHKPSTERLWERLFAMLNRAL